MLCILILYPVKRFHSISQRRAQCIRIAFGGVNKIEIYTNEHIEIPIMETEMQSNDLNVMHLCELKNLWHLHIFKNSIHVCALAWDFLSRANK